MPQAVTTIRFEDLKFSKEPIGRGGFSTVYKVEWTRKERENTGDLVHSRRRTILAAAKCLNKVTQSELEILSRLHHPTIVKLLGVVDEKPDFFLVFELCDNGELRRYLARNVKDGLHTCLITAWGEQAARALEYLHNEQVIHRDVKSSNFLITTSKNLKLCDFGLAKQADLTVTTKAKGTWGWVAPEVFIEDHLSPASDVFAYATLLWELLTCLIPFDKASYEEVRRRVCDQGERPQIPDNCPAPVAEIMAECWTADRTKRPKIGQVVKTMSEYRGMIFGQYSDDVLEQTLPHTRIFCRVADDNNYVDGVSIDLDSKHGDNLEKIKSLVATSETGSNKALTRKYNLFHGKTQLEDHLTLLDYDIGDGELLILQRSIKVILGITDASGAETSREIEAYLLDTIFDIKSKAGYVEGRLFYADHYLEDNSNISDITSGDEIRLLCECPLNIAVTFEDGDKREGRFYPSQTIHNMKMTLWEANECKPDIISGNGAHLEDRKTIVECGIKNNDILKGWKWRQKHKIKTGGLCFALCWATEKQCAICLADRVEVYQVSIDTTHLLYTLLVYVSPYEVAVNGPKPDRIFVLGEDNYIYQHPCHESLHCDKTFKVAGEDEHAIAIAANYTTAVVSIRSISNFDKRVLLVLGLPGFTSRHRIDLGFIVLDMCITTEYLLAMGRQQILYKKLDDMDQNICELNPPSGFEFTSVSSTHLSRQLYVAGYSRQLQKYGIFKYTNEQDTQGNVRLTDSGCVIQVPQVSHMYASMSISASGMMATVTDYIKDAAIYGLSVNPLLAANWSMKVSVKNLLGETIHVQASSNDTVTDIKTKAGLPDDVKLFHDTQCVEDCERLHTYWLENNAELRAEIEQDLILKCATARGSEVSWKVKVCPSHTLKYLKSMIRRGTSDIPPDSQLIYDSDTDDYYQQIRHVDRSRLLLEFPISVNINNAKDNQTESVRICPSQTIDEMKTTLKADTIVHNGDELDDQLTVSDCGIKDDDTLQALHWVKKCKLNESIGSVHWISTDQLAIGTYGRKVQIYQINPLSESGFQPMYSLVSDEWGGGLLSVATNGSNPDRIFVTHAYQPSVYEFPCQESTQYHRKHEIVDVRGIKSIASNSDTAVMNVSKPDGNSRYVVCSLPDFTQQRFLNLEQYFELDCHCIASHYVFLPVNNELHVRSLDNVDETLHIISLPGRFILDGVTARSDAKQLYVVCTHGDVEEAYTPGIVKYTWNGNGFPQYTRSYCTIVVDDYRSSCSLSASGYLALASLHDDVIEVYNQE